MKNTAEKVQTSQDYWNEKQKRTLCVGFGGPETESSLSQEKVNPEICYKLPSYASCLRAQIHPKNFSVLKDFYELLAKNQNLARINQNSIFKNRTTSTHLKQSGGFLDSHQQMPKNNNRMTQFTMDSSVKPQSQ